MEKQYNLLIDTLNLLILPLKEKGTPYLSLIQSQIDELEGDYYTFLHKDNIQKLVTSGYISVELIDKIEQIRTQISEIKNSLWNPLDFIDNIQWQKIRGLVLELLKKEMII